MQSIIAQVSLFNQFRYTICVAREYSGVKPKIGFGHFFNINAKNILEIQKSSLIIPKIKLTIPCRYL